MRTYKKGMFIVVVLFLITACSPNSATDLTKKVTDFLSPLAKENAEWALTQAPVTITDFVCERSEGAASAFYSEGDYWWPDPENPDGPYIRRDGETNPDNFVAHRHAMIRFSRIVGALTSAWIITKDQKYALHAKKHLNAWFVDSATAMFPHLLYAQAIKGKVSGRGIGIIDTIHLMEVAQSVIKMRESGVFSDNELDDIILWFQEYLNWMTTHEYGKTERDAKNNHGTCWTMQVASFAKLTQNDSLLNFCRDRYKNALLPNQMAQNGSFPLETERTKPYGYSLFNLDAMATICQILSDNEHDLWIYTTQSGLGIKQGVDFMTPYVKDKNLWPFPHDVMYWDNWPVAQPFLIFAAIQYNNPELYTLWECLEHRPTEDEVIRNLPIRNPVLWIN